MKYDLFYKHCEKHRNHFLKCLESPQREADVLWSKLNQKIQNTVFNKKYDLPPDADFNLFRKKVPIHSYDMLRPYIERILHSEKNVLINDSVYMFYKTSGTTGQAKVIPANSFWRTRFRAPARYAQWGFYFHKYGFLRQSDVIMDLTWERMVPDQFYGLYPLQSITQRHAVMNSRDWCPPWYSDSWFDFRHTPELSWRDRLYTRLRYFIDKPLSAIAAPNPSTIIFLLDLLCNAREEILKDVRDGTLWNRKFTQPNSKRTHELEKIFKNNSISIPQAVWPTLRILMCWKSNSCALYIPHLEKYVPQADVIPYASMATEGMISLWVDMNANSDHTTLAISYGLYEFVPQDIPVTENTETLLFNELEKGKRYRLISTQGNGLFRYDTGDLFEVEGFYRSVPLITFCGRNNILSSLTGEKLTASDIQQAVAFASNTCRVPIDSYFFFPKISAIPYPYYVLLINKSLNLPLNHILAFKDAIDQNIQKLNIEYKSKRETNRIGAVSLVTLKNNSTLDLISLFKSKSSNFQSKINFFQKDDSLLNKCLEHNVFDIF